MPYATVHSNADKKRVSIIKYAVESDHSYPVPHDRVLEAYKEMSCYVKSILDEGAANGEFTY
ncbi:hypothetical protein KY305_17270 [Bacillus sp. YC2]|uniref:hypothetical protein n=1 Tax=Bacillus sp. YC2 TaxID=2861287 RepID=UPI001CA63598|nr:hypothetical protein [Bacillus sp. YC2]MBY8914488.1 hypothetical protein [Bacillus sp. YC2]